MRFLLDTHVFLWLVAEPHHLSNAAASLLADDSNTILVSHVSIWEMKIKQAVGKLSFSTPLQTLIQDQQAQNRITLLPIDLSHIFALDELPLHHRDPFDRLLIAQALHEGIALLSGDAKFSAYPITLVW